MNDDLTYDEFDTQYEDGLTTEFEAAETGFDEVDYGGDGFDDFDFEADWSYEGADGFDFEGLDGIDEWGFLKKIARGVGKAAKAALPVAKMLAPIAGKAIGGALGGPAGAMIGGKLGGIVSNMEDEDGMDEMAADQTFLLDSLDEETAQKLADAASKTKNPATAGALAAASAATVAAKAPPKVKAVLPTVASASSNVANVMTKAKGGDVLKKALPTIQHKTVATLTAKAAKGKPVTPETAKRVMAKQTAKVLRSGKELSKAIARNEVKRRSLDKKAIMRAEGFDDAYGY